MRITATEEYGVRCLLHVARAGESNKSVTIREVAEKEGISLDYATKLMTLLRQGGLVNSVRGANGGYTLSRPVDDVSLAEILRSLDDAFADEGKITTSKLCEKFPGQKDGCVHMDNCTVRPVWLTLSDYLYGSLHKITLRHMLEKDEAETAKHIKAAFKEYAGTL